MGSEITERAEVEALPVGSVVVDSFAAICVRINGSVAYGWRRCTPAVKNGEHRHPPYLPGELIWEGASDAE